METASESRFAAWRLLACCGALHLAIALSIPWFEPATHNDDWVYAHPVRRWLASQTWELHPAAGALGLPQIVAACLAGEVLQSLGVRLLTDGHAPFALLRGGMTLLSLAATWFCFRLLRQLDVPPRLAWWSTLLFAANPLTVSLAWSFHTDLFAATCVLGALAVLTQREQPSVRDALLAAGLFGLATLTRQTALVLSVAAAILLARRGDRNAACVIGLGACAAWLLQRVLGDALVTPYLRYANGVLSAALRRPSLGQAFIFVYEGLHAVALLGLFLLPLLGWRSGERLARRWLLAGAFAMGVMALCDASSGRGVLCGNYLYLGERWGVGPPTLEISQADGAGVGRLRPGIVGTLVTLSGLLGGTWLVARLGSELVSLVRAVRTGSIERRQFVATLLFVELGVLLAVTALLRRPIFDRYVLTMLPLGLALASPSTPSLRAREASGTRAEPDRRSFLVPAAGGLLFVLSYVSTVDYWQWNAARWKALAWLESQGIPPTAIDGGYEYNGLHETLAQPAALQALLPARPAPQDTAPPTHFYTVRFAPRSADEEIVARFAYRRPLVGTRRHLVVARRKLSAENAP